MNEPHPTDEAAVDLIRAGDPRGVEVLYDRYSRVVYSMALKIVGSAQLAEEITQEVFLKVWRQASGYDRSRGKFMSWLLGITHNLAVDELRRASVRPQAVYAEVDRADPVTQIADSSPTPDEVALGGVTRSAVREALGALPAEQRQALELAYFGGLTQAEIANQTGIPLGTIKTRMRLGLQYLRADAALSSLWSDTS